MTRLTKYYPFEGGLDLVTPPLALKEGAVLGSLNYEIETGTNKGYRRIDGYERFDGQPSPSEGTYWVIPFDAGAVEPPYDDVVVGITSLARGHILAIELTAGAWDGTAEGYLVVFLKSGTYVNDENLVAGNHAFSIGFEHVEGVAKGFE